MKLILSWTFLIFCSFSLKGEEKYWGKVHQFLLDSKDCDHKDVQCGKLLKEFKQEKLNELELLVLKMVFYLKASEHTMVRLLIKEFLQKDPKNDLEVDINPSFKNPIFIEILREIKKLTHFDDLLLFFFITIDPQNLLKLYNPPNWSNQDIKLLFSSVYNGLGYPRFWFIYLTHTKNLSLLKEYLLKLKKNWSYLTHLHSDPWPLNT